MNGPSGFGASEAELRQPLEEDRNREVTALVSAFELAASTSTWSAPHPYQTKPPVNVTWKAMQIVRAQWHCAGCRKLLKGE